MPSAEPQLTPAPLTPNVTLVPAFSVRPTVHTWSIARSTTGLFNLSDAIDPETGTVTPAAVLSLFANGTALPLQSGPAAVVYMKQERLRDSYGNEGTATMTAPHDLTGPQLSAGALQTGYAVAIIAPRRTPAASRCR